MEENKKKYPRRPYLISSSLTEKYWAIIPFCLFLLICRGMGIVGAIMVFLVFFINDLNLSQKEWEMICDRIYKEK